MAYSSNIYNEAMRNSDFCRVVATGMHSQVEVANLEQGQELGEETMHCDQILIGVGGSGEVTVDGQIYSLSPNTLVLISSGSTRNVFNRGGSLKFAMISAPAEFASGGVFHDKEEAENAELV